MRTKFAILVVLTLGACATAEPLPRRSLAPAAARPTSSLGAERVFVEALERSDPAPAARTAPDPSAARPAAPVHRSFIERVEVPVDRGVEAQQGSREYGYEDYARRSIDAPQRSPDPFPTHTAVGAGVGAILGHQSGRRDAGALIGGGIGLLFDLGRWSR
ncbi:MAG: hypothetical protein CMJ88_00700 [Planctomycetes bacterium]|nr:hypothetical protein [Planctomycetota bacterium]